MIDTRWVGEPLQFVCSDSPKTRAGITRFNNALLSIRAKRQVVKKDTCPPPKPIS